MALFSGQAYEEVARLLAGGWAGPAAGGSGSGCRRPRRSPRPEPGSARAVGVAVCQVGRPLATPETKGAWYRGLRVLSLDGTTLEVPDTPANRPRSGGRQAAAASRPPSPRCACSAVAECGTHAIIQATIGPLASGEVTLAPRYSAVRARGCCCWPTAASPVLELWRQAHRDRRGAGVADETNAVLPVPSPWPMAPTSARSSPPATTARPRPDHRCGWWSTPLARTPAALASRALPAADHDPGPHPGTRGRAGRAVPPALGVRDRPG